MRSTHTENQYVSTTALWSVCVCVCEEGFPLSVASVRPSVLLRLARSLSFQPLSFKRGPMCAPSVMSLLLSALLLPPFP